MGNLRKGKNLLVAASCMLALITIPHSGYAQMSPRLKQFLESRNFHELIETYKQEKITLFTEGERVARETARPYTAGKGFRCQVFAGAREQNALQAAERLKTLNLDSVYVIETPSHLYKVQIGNFQTRQEAEVFLDKLRNAGEKDAWIVPAEIHIPKKEAAPSPTPQSEPAAGQELSQQLYFTIQVFATNDLLRAFQVKKKLQSEFNQPVEVAARGSIWKVLIGKFPDRPAAEKFLEDLRKNKYEDAWITQVAGTSD